MPKRSSKGLGIEDGNETAFRVVQTATEEPDPALLGLLAAAIHNLRDGLVAGDDDATLARRLWPSLDELLAHRHALAAEQRGEGVKRWRDAPHPAAAELGSRG